MRFIQVENKLGIIDDDVAFTSKASGGALLYAMKYQASRLETPESFWGKIFLYTFWERPVQGCLYCNPFSGKIGYSELQPKQIKSGETFYGDAEQHIEAISKARGYSVCIEDLAPLEIVDSYQWQGLPPQEIKKDDKVVEKASLRWDISTVDHKTGSRLVFYSGHNHKDDVFRLRAKMQKFLDYWSTILDPIIPDIRDLNPEGYACPSAMPSDRSEHASDVIQGSINRRIDDFPYP